MILTYTFDYAIREVIVYLIYHPDVMKQVEMQAHSNADL